ncbi:MAG: FUSC family protein [Mycobacterium sp.]
MGTTRRTVPPAALAASRAGLKRLRGTWFNLAQTSVASGLAWYLAHDLLRHPQPFFAPIAAAVSLSISNVLRAQRAIQMMIGVTLGIGVGTLVQGALGPGAVSIGVAALIALCAAVFIGHGLIGQGMMFANQTVVSAILVLALFRSGVGWERINDALIGGVVAIVFAVLLFPADPLQLLRSARAGVLGALRGVLTRTADVAAGRRVPAHDWPLLMADRVHQQLGGLIEARATARQVVRVAPRRWGVRDAVRAADQQATHVAQLAGSVLQLARVVVPAVGGCCDRLTNPVPAVLVQLAAATALADSDPAGAAAYTAAARRDASKMQADARDRTEVVLAGAVAACVDDLQRVIELRQF